MVPREKTKEARSELFHPDIDRGKVQFLRVTNNQNFVFPLPHLRKLISIHRALLPCPQIINGLTEQHWRKVRKGQRSVYKITGMDTHSCSTGTLTKAISHCLLKCHYSRLFFGAAAELEWQSLTDLWSLWLLLVAPAKHAPSLAVPANSSSSSLSPGFWVLKDKFLNKLCWPSNLLYFCLLRLQTIAWS